MGNKKLLQECIKYFKSSAGYKRLFEGIGEKYRSLGYIGGTVIIKNPTPVEREAISGLLKRDCYSSRSISVKADILIKAIEETKFAGVVFEEVLKGYFSGSLISKKDEKDIYKAEKDKYFAEVLSMFGGTTGCSWLRHALENHENASKIINQRYDRDKERLRLDLIYTIKGLNRLSFSEKNTTRLAIFSSEVSKNPHCFDMDKECGKLLLQGIAYILKVPVPQNSEDRAELLYRAGIINDEVSNYTMCSNIKAYIKGIPHGGWQGFSDKGEPLLVSLYNLACIDEIKCPGRRVYVFENPTVFSEVLMNTCSAKPSLVCTYGQVKLASLILLDRLIDNVDFIYYSGDFDPEGIIIADKLKQRYKGKLILWRYDIEDYKSIKSKERINELRLKKLTKIKDQGLLKVSEVLRREGLAAYQELLVERYIEDIMEGTQSL